MSDQMGGSQTPAGWYPDPNDGTRLRYWDGSQWTEHTSPAAGAQQPAQAGWQQGAAAGEKVDTWLWQSIVATLLCCLPAGIVGIVFSSQAQSAVTAGNLPEAREKAAKAKTWTLVAVGLGLAAIVTWIVLVAVGVGTFSIDSTF